MFVTYDVETTGIPDWKKPSIDPSQPRVIQLAAILCEDDGTIVKTMNRYVKPDGWTVPEEIFKLTGISQALLEADGLPIAEVVAEFLELLKECSLTVAHNDSFDRRLLRIELLRLFGEGKIADDWKEFPKFCTCVNSTEVCRLPPTDKMMAAGRKNYKTPKLEEAYEHFFGKKPDKMHDALADVESTLAIYLKLRR